MIDCLFHESQNRWPPEQQDSDAKKTISPICLSFVDNSWDYKVNSVDHGAILCSHRQTYRDYIRRGFSSELSFEEAIQLADRVRNVSLQHTLLPDVMVALAQLKVIRDSFKRLEALVQNGTGSEEEKANAAQLFQQFFNRFAYEVVFCIPLPL